jgi:hypothetical protein
MEKKKNIAEFIKLKIAEFLKQHLKLNLSPTKTKITNLKTTAAKFLGFSIKTYIKRRLSLSKFGDYTKRAGWDLIIDVDLDRLVDRLILKGFSNLKRKPVAKHSWAVLQAEEITKRYNYIIRGIGNYYCPVIDRYSNLNYICYILKFSCLSTFAKKYKSKITKITQKYGDPLTITINEKITKSGVKVNEKNKTFSLLTYPKFKELLQPHKFDWKNRSKIRIIEENVFLPMTTINWRTRRNLTNVCAICGADRDVEMHHIRHIRKGEVTGFSQVLKQINRTMIPLCRTHLREVHNGKYDGVKLEDLYGLERFLS